MAPGMFRYNLPRDFNNLNQVILVAHPTAYVHNQAFANSPPQYFLYSNGSFTELFPTGGVAGAVSAQPFKINNTGTIIGLTNDCVWPSCYGMGIGFFSQNGIRTSLNIPMSTGIVATMQAGFLINDSGMVAGERYYTNGFLRRANGSIEDLPSNLKVEHLTNSGIVLGRREYLQNGIVTPVPAPAVPMAIDFMLESMTEDGIMVGYVNFEAGANNHYTEPFAYDPSTGVWRDLKTSPSANGVYELATEINENHWIQVYRANGGDYILKPAND